MLDPSSGCHGVRSKEGIKDKRGGEGRGLIHWGQRPSKTAHARSLSLSLLRKKIQQEDGCLRARKVSPVGTAGGSSNVRPRAGTDPSLPLPEARAFGTTRGDRASPPELRLAAAYLSGTRSRDAVAAEQEGRNTRRPPPHPRSAPSPESRGPEGARQALASPARSLDTQVSVVLFGKAAWEPASS